MNDIEDRYDPIALNAIIFERSTSSKRKFLGIIKPHGMWFYVFLVFCAIIKEFIKILTRFPLLQWFEGWHFYKHMYDGRIVFVLPSINNLRSLQSVISFVKDKKDNVEIMDGKTFYKSLPQFYAFWKCIEKVPLLLKRISSLPYKDRCVVANNFTHFFIAAGYTCCYKKILTKFRPECIILSNDHLCYCKALALLCEELGIKTIYVQHASVASFFPELHFSFSFLDGMDAFEKYTLGEKNLFGKAILLGAVRYDGLNAYRVQRDNRARHCIGVSINSVDDNTIVNDICNKLLRRYGDIMIKIRSHPALKKKPFSFDNKERIIYTCATDESIFYFFDSIDFQIAGDSGVHLDAILSGVSTIAYNFSRTSYNDFYKYVERGLVDKAHNFDEIIDIIDNNKFKTADKSLIRLYDDSYEKSYAGSCSKIVADFINNNCNFEYLKDNYKLVIGEFNNHRFWTIE